MDEDKKTDELENQLEQATQKAQEEENNNFGGNQPENNSDSFEDKNESNQGAGISPDLGTAKEQMKEDGIEIL